MSDPGYRAIEDIVFDSDMRVRQQADRAAVAVLFYLLLAALIVGVYFGIDKGVT